MLRTGAEYDKADICLVLEGSYPFIFGGVSAWTQSLIESMDDLSFAVVAIRPDAPEAEWKYPRPGNLVRFQDIPLGSDQPGSVKVAAGHADEFSTLLCDLVTKSVPVSIANLLRFLERNASGRDAATLLEGQFGWAVARRCYETLTPGASFLQFFWAWRSFYGSVLRVLSASIPQARVYHALTTGYAGLMTARAAIETGRPAILTEHGIYTNERRIDLMLATWLQDTLPRGLEDARALPLPGDIRDFWIAGFESLARISYAASREIISLSAAGRTEQLALGVDAARALIIPNGIEPGRFSDVRRADDGVRRIAFVGRLVAIKDVLTFLRAVALLREGREHFKALVVGPEDEEPGYAARCRAEAERLGLGGVVDFTGMRPMAQVLAEIDVLVLTSTSESLPLVLLEAGAAAVPCVATDVGACRDVILGAPDEDPPLGQGGRITRLAAPADTAAAVAELLDDADLRSAAGAALKARVRRHYRADAVRDAYRAKYGRLAGEPDAGPWQA